MASTKSNVRKLKAQPRTLTSDELTRIAERIAARIEHDEEEIALLLLFFDHLEALAEQPDSYLDLWSALSEFKQHLFLGTSASDDAQKSFQAKAYANRGTTDHVQGDHKREGG